MRAIVQNGYGSALDVLRPAEIDRPPIKPDEVLIRVRAAGLDRGTWLFTAGQPYAVRLGLGLRGPRGRVAGMDVAGTVVAVGAAVTRFAVDDEVFGVGRGSFAEYTAAKQTRLAHKPAGLGFEQAAVIAVSGVTALQSLRDVGRLRAGQHVLVIGASGGVGSYAVQLARAFGAEVTGVCSTEKTDFVRSLGADHVIDYQRTDFVDSGRRYDLIVDIGGDSSLSRLRRALTPRGTLVIVGGAVAGKWLGLGRQTRALTLSPFVRQRLTTFIAKQRHSDMETLAELIEAGRVTPAVEATYALADTPKAVARLAAGEVRGKIAISVGPSQTDDRE
ncbi:NADPH:quinone reductase-like Zn-dependent oxidoreductase [Catenulispora sp. GP43]|uniref:NAD(P)-dependent alcohol dehydrogenase n=1 Tax=Catenulispora sp. GP43 TaxID=3156263 RepID=UPI003516BA57